MAMNPRIMTARCALTIFLAAWLVSCASRTGTPDAMTPARSADVRALHRGERLYQGSCAACHGADARGHGPVAPILKVAVPDLTLIGARRGGVFPEEEIYRLVDGQAALGAHGPRNMPIWGYEFYGDDPDDERAHQEASMKIEDLTAFLRSIQRPAEP